MELLKVLLSPEGTCWEELRGVQEGQKRPGVRQGANPAGKALLSINSSGHVQLPSSRGETPVPPQLWGPARGIWATEEPPRTAEEAVVEGAHPTGAPAQ